MVSFCSEGVVTCRFRCRSVLGRCHGSQSFPAALTGSSALILGQALQPQFLKEAFTGMPFQATLLCAVLCLVKWLCLDLQAVGEVCLSFQCLPSGHGMVLTKSIALPPASFLHSQEFSVQQNSFDPCLCFLFGFFPLVISVVTAGQILNMVILQQCCPANNTHMHSQSCQKCLSFSKKCSIRGSFK